MILGILLITLTIMCIGAIPQAEPQNLALSPNDTIWKGFFRSMTTADELPLLFLLLDFSEKKTYRSIVPVWVGKFLLGSYLSVLGMAVLGSRMAKASHPFFAIVSVSQPLSTQRADALYILVFVMLCVLRITLFAVLAAISFVGLQRAMPETATRLGEKLSVKELGRDYRLVLKNLRFVAGALATGFVSLPLLAWIAQSPVIIISGEQATSYEYGMLQVPIFGALIAGNLVLARLTSRRTVRSLIIMGGWPIVFGLLLSAAATVVSSHAYLWMTAGLSFYAFGIGLANAGLVRLTLFASEMSKGTVSAAMGMLQMLIFTVGIELSKHAYELGGNGLFSLFNLLGGVLWLGLMIYFLKDKSVGNSQQG